MRVHVQIFKQVLKLGHGGSDLDKQADNADSADSVTHKSHDSSESSGCELMK